MKHDLTVIGIQLAVPRLICVNVPLRALKEKKCQLPMIESAIKKKTVYDVDSLLADRALRIQRKIGAVCRFVTDFSFAETTLPIIGHMLTPISLPS